MLTAKFHSDEKDHSLLGFGAMRFPTLKDGSVDESTAIAMIDEAYQNGVTYFDTAYIYHNGKSEAFLGKALSRYPRESYSLADKLPMWLIHTANDMEQIFEEQLKRCNVEYFDYYLAHSLGKKSVAKMRELGTIDFLKRKKAEGKIKHIGFSFHDDVTCLRDIFTMHEWEFCQLQINYADWVRSDAKELYECTVEHHVPVIVMEPVRGGFLANPAKAVTDILQDCNPNRSIASWAFRFLTTLPNVKLVLSGMSTPDQVHDNLSTFADESIYLSNDEKIALQQAMDVLSKINTIPCTGCSYCMPCPAGVDIPTIFKLYNNTKLFNNESNYSSVATDQRADHCVRCGACMTACPQNLQIPELLAMAHPILVEKDG